MDPDETLKQLRQAVVRTRGALNGDGDLIREAAQLADHAEALDDWLRGGGFAPAAWRGR